MLMPQKHVTLEESLLGLGAFLLQKLSRPKTLDQLFGEVEKGRKDQVVPLCHDHDAVLASLAFLYLIGAVDSDNDGVIKKCD